MTSGVERPLLARLQTSEEKCEHSYLARRRRGKSHQGRVVDALKTRLARQLLFVLALPLMVVGFVGIRVYDGVSYGVDLAGDFDNWLRS